jgi:hypothetical protein
MRKSVEIDERTRNFGGDIHPSGFSYLRRSFTVDKVSPPG